MPTLTVQDDKLEIGIEKEETDRQATVLVRACGEIKIKGANGGTEVIELSDDLELK